MVLTNALLSIGFSLVTQFTNVVHIPADLVPTRAEDLRQIVVGHWRRPTDLSILHRAGTAFGIDDGVVDYFSTADSLLGLQDPSEIARLLGKATFTSNQVVELATRTVEMLARTTNPIANIKPTVVNGRKFQGKVIPFYQITWPKPFYNPGFGFFAGIEIDARNGQITHLELHDPAFFNYEFALEISNRVYVPDPPEPVHTPMARPMHRLFPSPSTNEVVQGIASWLWLCHKLGADPGASTNLASVNWDRTIVCTNVLLPGAPVVCEVEFTNGAGFSLSRGVIIFHKAADVFFDGNWPAKIPDQAAPFMGRIKSDWLEMALNVEHALVRLGVPAAIMDRLTACVEYAPPGKIGQSGFKRQALTWKEKGRTGDEAFMAEFDLETGELKEIAFFDPRIIEALGRAQRLEGTTSR